MQRERERDKLNTLRVVKLVLRTFMTDMNVCVCMFVYILINRWGGGGKKEKQQKKMKLLCWWFESRNQSKTKEKKTHGLRVYL